MQPNMLERVVRNESVVGAVVSLVLALGVAALKEAFEEDA